MRLIDADALLERLYADKGRFEHDTSVSATNKGITFAILKHIADGVAGTPTHSPWIKINESEDLPPEGEDVLLLSNGKRTHGSYSTLLQAYSAHALEVPNVTHWMHWPGLPEKEDDSND